jgi:tRNA U34 2-thiouridine synthase MnmA/TrmU
MDLKKTKIIDVDSKKYLGEIEGGITLSIGQRITLGGTEKKIFCVSKDKNSNKIYATSNTEHPSFFNDDFTVEEMKWITGYPSTRKIEKENFFSFRCLFRIRHTQSLSPCTIFWSAENDSIVSVVPDVPIKSLSLLQVCAFYTFDEKICVGAGLISSLGENYQKKNKKAPAQYIS